MNLSKDLVIQKVLETVPKNCYSCGQPLVLTKDYMHLYCENPECSGKFYRKVEIMAKAFGIENVGIKVAQELVEHLNSEGSSFTKLYELYDFSKEDFLKVPRFKEGLSSKLYESIQKVQEVPFENFIKGIQLKRVGEGTSGDLAKAFDSLEDLLSATKNQISNALKVPSDLVAGYIYDSIQEQKEEILGLSSRVKIVYPEKVEQLKDLSNITAVITGSLKSMSRKDFEKKYNDLYGVKFTSAISRNANYLIYNGDKNPEKPSSKLIKAKSLGINIVSEEEFINLLSN